MHVSITCYNPKGEDRTHQNLDMVTPENYKQKILRSIEWWLEDLPEAVLSGKQPMTIKMEINNHGLLQKQRG